MTLEREPAPAQGEPVREVTRTKVVVQPDGTVVKGEPTRAQTDRGVIIIRLPGPEDGPVVELAVPQ